VPPGKFSKLSSMPPKMSSTRALSGAMVVPISQLVPNILQVRQHFDLDALQELADDIKARGILEPLLVREAEPGSYEIIAGERRYRAAQVAGLVEVPVIVRQMDDKEAQFTMLAENLQRADLDPLDEQRFFQTLQREYNLSYSDIAKLINKSKGYVQNRLEGRIQALDENRSSQLQLSDNSQSGVNVVTSSTSTKRTSSSVNYNPAVYKRVSQFWDSTLQAIDNNPDEATVKQIRESIEDTEQKLAELKQKLAHVEEREQGN